MGGRTKRVRKKSERKKTTKKNKVSSRTQSIESELRESGLMYRAVVDNIGIGVAIINPNMEIISLNRQMREWFPGIDVSKKPVCYEVFNDPPRDNICSYCPTCETLRDGRVHESITNTLTGENFRNFRVISAPVFDDNRNIIAAIEIVEDITKERKILEELQEKMTTFHAITSTAKDAIIMIDDNGLINYWNPAAENIFGYTEDEVIGKELHHIIAPEKYHNSYHENFEKFKKTGKGKIIGKTIEFEALRKSGEKFPVELSLSSIKIKNRWYAVGVARDITRRKRITDELKRYQENLEDILSERTKELEEMNKQLNIEIEERKKVEDRLIQINEVLSMINKILRHDILNDLTVVSSSIEVYRENKDGKFLETAYKSVERSVELIKRMRELESLVSSGVSLRPFDVRDTLQTAINNWMNEGIEFTIKGDSVVLADETFVSVIENIIRNAVVHGRADRVEIAVRDDGEYTEIRIADNGTGVPDELKEEIFEEGFTGNSKGTGLGLYIARKTVERYGGSIRVEDNKPRGAIFILTLKTVSDYSGIRSSLKIPVTDHHSSVSNFSKAEEWKGDDKMIEVETDRKEVEIDLKGLKCPQPILRIHSKVVTLSNGSILKVKADCPTFERDLKIWAEKTGKTVMECVKSGDVWNARILA